MSVPALHSCLYLGRVMHRRLRPFSHRFSYPVFSLFLDLDELEVLGRRSRVFSYNRFNLFSFHDRDHGARDGSALRPWIEGHLRAAGLDLRGGPIRLLCFPRILGYVFNPLSIWYCYSAQGRLGAVLYEVRNTFGEKHGYLIPLGPDHKTGQPIIQSCEKGFYVSPFMEMTAAYRFRLMEPDEGLSILIRQWTPAGETLLATQTGRRADFSDRSLLGAFFRYPLMTLKVMTAIHWQALKIWRKGAAYHKRPPAPSAEVAVTPPTTTLAAE